MTATLLSPGLWLVDGHQVRRVTVPRRRRGRAEWWEVHRPAGDGWEDAPVHVAITLADCRRWLADR